jgi:hypothetical protein
LRRLRPFGDRPIVGAAPADRIAIVAPRGGRRLGTVVEHIGENVPGVVQHNVHDHVDAARMRLVDEAAELAVGVRLIRCKPRVYLQEVLDAIAVIRAVLGLAVL